MFIFCQEILPSFSSFRKLDCTGQTTQCAIVSAEKKLPDCGGSPKTTQHFQTMVSRDSIYGQLAPKTSYRFYDFRTCFGRASLYRSVEKSTNVILLETYNEKILNDLWLKSHENQVIVLPAGNDRQTAKTMLLSEKNAACDKALIVLVGSIDNTAWMPGLSCFSASPFFCGQSDYFILAPGSITIDSALKHGTGYSAEIVSSLFLLLGDYYAKNTGFIANARDLWNCIKKGASVPYFYGGIIHPTRSLFLLKDTLAKQTLSFDLALLQTEPRDIPSPFYSRTSLALLYPFMGYKNFIDGPLRYRWLLWAKEIQQAQCDTK